MRHLPSQDYCGLTIVVSNPSRYDKEALLSGYAGIRFNQECLQAVGINRWQCDIRLSTDNSILLPETKALLLLGDKAFKEWTNKNYDSYTLGEQRGYPLHTDSGLPTIATYLPQDAVDRIDHESRLNPILRETELDENGSRQDEGEKDNSGSDDDDIQDEGDVKRHGVTRRSNYFFWLQRDTAKILAAIRNPIIATPSKWNAILAPATENAIAYLNRCVGSMLYLDIECHPDTRDMFCIGVNVEDSDDVLVIPILRHDYSTAYSDLHRILRALSKAMRNNTVVAHNSMFDLSILAHKYSLPFGRSVYDTMLANHRCFPEAEKSLGHCMSCWPSIWESFHKDQGVFPPYTSEQDKALWSYNAKDVWAMKLIRRAQLAYATTKPGLLASIGQACSMVRPYIISTLQGIRYNEQMRADKVTENDKLMTHYLRALKILVGHELLPTSPQQCVKYLHGELGYSIMARTKTNAPSVGDKTLQKMKLKYPNNAVIDFILSYRERAKEAGMLRFNPWIQETNTI